MQVQRERGPACYSPLRAKSVSTIIRNYNRLSQEQHAHIRKSRVCSGGYSYDMYIMIVDNEVGLRSLETCSEQQTVHL